ncbi:heparan-alpha-glucosaminide N-acetyltransferase domain-containing protein [Micrococcus sp. TA1]|uniref:heparan-alpha-glucosaminide N-acetyltransferase domain-containing protein n=1 Tax=Micrococcus sp. TA1 TaxID=681627 RepID=UPI00160BBEF5|nr:heparan-alpha-glucosaminide N-acetyltransferase domain-containing protein [Micrococcus sp. TA1]MBB5749609.1 putative membrane protein [Micrococcus sp. TA1]
MSTHEASQDAAVSPLAPPAPRRTGRLIGIDAARGLALIGLIAIHIFPDETDAGDPTLAWNLFSGDSAALFALLAGVGLAFSTGGATPHRGRQLAADRLGLVARALVIGAIGLVISAILPWDPPANNILTYYAVFFLLTIPFLHLRTRALFLSAAAFAVIFPILLQQVGPELPESSAWNHTVVNLVTEPLGTVSELLLTGNYPALAYMTYLLVGLGLGRLNLRSTRVQAMIAGAGAALAALSHLLSALLLGPAGGYNALLAASDLSEDELDWTLTFGSEEIPDTSAWWLAVDTPHANTTLAIGASLGLGLLVTGLFLLLAERTGRVLMPLAAMGSMTLTLYSAHLIALAPELHYDDPTLWFVLHLAAAAAFAWYWHRRFGQGPLEKGVATVARRTRQLVLDREPGSVAAGTATTPPSSTPPSARPGA